MKKLILLAFLVMAYQVNAQMTFTPSYNQYGTPSITVGIGNLGNTQNIDQLGALNAFQSNSINFMAQGQEIWTNSNIEVKVFFQNTAIQLYVSGLSKGDLLKLQNLQDSVYLGATSDISIPLQGGSSLAISKQSLETQSKGKIIVPDSLVDSYLGSFGGAFAYASNSFNWGFTPASSSDNGKFELNAEFSFRKNYGSKSELIFFTKGRVSTNPKDSLNYLYIYPLNFSFWKNNNTELFGQVGMESSQTFSSNRVAANFSIQTLLPNLVDMTMGNPRFRLKPVFNFGVKAYQEFDNLRTNSDNEFSIQANASLFYNVPLFDNYNIIFESTGYYDFNDGVNPQKSIKFNYSIALTATLPNTPIQTVFKFKDGQVDVNNLSGDSNITIGLLANLESLVGISN